MRLEAKTMAQKKKKKWVIVCAESGTRDGRLDGESECVETPGVAQDLSTTRRDDEERTMMRTVVG